MSERVPPADAAATDQAPVAHGPGGYIGPYKILQQIGEGGFGSIYEAEQTHPVKRRVALKVIKLGMDTRDVIARFEAERQALALMDHPHVARVFDAGSSSDGRPYFVMELVKGVPITSYCDKHRLGIVERLELFDQVCEAVQHAHTKGIIHRDLKPSNVLVSEHDDRAFAKVIDFGIAKAISGRLTDRTLLTHQDQMIGTPLYMSPEQAEGSADIDTRTDIYSLGVMLYELLTGTTPFEAHSLRAAAYAEVQRIIREVEPPAPSRRLSELGLGTQDLLTSRGGSNRKLSRMIRGEIDWIVMKSLEKERARRYETAHGLAMDVRRYLSGQPVQAAPPSASYRLRKFVRRNRTMVAAGMLIAVSLLSGILSFAWQARIAVQSAREAEQAGRRAQAVNDFVLQVLRLSDPNQGGNRELTIAAAMQSAAAELQAGAFADDPATRASLAATIGTVLLNNGRAAEAEPLLRQAVQLRLAVAGDGDAEMNAISVTLARCLRDLGRHAEAERLLRTVVEARRQEGARDAADLAEAISQLGVTLRVSGNATAAEIMHREALAELRKQFSGDHAQIASTLNQLGGVVESLGRHEEAASLFVEALEMRRRIFPGDHPDVGGSLNNAGYVMRVLGRFDQAEAYLRDALSMRTRLYAGDHPNVAISQSNLAYVLHQLGHIVEAESLHRQVLATFRRLYSGDHPDTFKAAVVLAEFLAETERVDEARILASEAVASGLRLYPDGHPRLANGIAALAWIEFRLGQVDAARAHIDEAEAMARQFQATGGFSADKVLGIKRRIFPDVDGSSP